MSSGGIEKDPDTGVTSVRQKRKSCSAIDDMEERHQCYNEFEAKQA